MVGWEWGVQAFPCLVGTGSRSEISPREPSGLPNKCLIRLLLPRRATAIPVAEILAKGKRGQKSPAHSHLADFHQQSGFGHVSPWAPGICLSAPFIHRVCARGYVCECVRVACACMCACVSVCMRVQCVRACVVPVCV